LEYTSLIVAIVFFCFMLFGSLHPLLSLVFTSFLGVMYVIGCLYTMIEMQRMLPLVVPLMGLVAAWVGSVIYRLCLRVRKAAVPLGATAREE